MYVHGYILIFSLYYLLYIYRLLSARRPLNHGPPRSLASTPVASGHGQSGGRRCRLPRSQSVTYTAAAHHSPAAAQLHGHGRVLRQRGDYHVGKQWRRRGRLRPCARRSTTARTDVPVHHRRPVSTSPTTWVLVLGGSSSSGGSLSTLAVLPPRTAPGHLRTAAAAAATAALPPRYLLSEFGRVSGLVHTPENIHHLQTVRT